MKKTDQLIFLALSLLIFTPMLISAQQDSGQTDKKLLMHHEVPDDAHSPNMYENTKTSPAYSFRDDIFFTTQVNVNQFGQNILGDAANEPSITIDPVDPDRMAIGWRQFDNVNSNFRQAGYGYTSDGGETWVFPGVIDPGVFHSDPVLDSDLEGNLYYNSLSGDFSCFVYKIEAGSFGWDNGTYAYGGDKQWMVIDKTGGQGAGNIYSFWTNTYSTCPPGAFTRSANFGTSYEDCIEVDGDPYWGTMAIGPEGELYIGGSGYFNGIIVSKSTTAQNPSSQVNWDFFSQVSLDGELTGWTAVNPAGLLGQASIAVDNSFGPGRGNVYVLASVARNSNSDPADVMFAKSEDGGMNWTAPMRINDDVGTSNYQWFGTMSVAPNGRIDVVWLDTRDDNPGTYWSALYYSYSFDQGETWTANTMLSQAFDPHVGWPQQDKMGDYFDMISDDNCAHLAWANTINGEQDVYYGRISQSTVATENRNDNRDFLSLTCYPVPSAGNTTIRYILNNKTDVKLAIYDLDGREIKVLVNSVQEAGAHQIVFNVAGLQDGVYICQLQTAGLMSSVRIVVVR